MSGKEYVFRRDVCDLCGECLHRCPVMDLSLEESREEIKRLVNGETSKYVLNACTSCMSCDLFCAQKANPYHIIQERWNERYKAVGAPPLYRFVCPTCEPNIWQLLNIFLTDREREWIRQWMDNTPSKDDEVVLLGNYLHLFPFIAGGSALLEHFTPIDRIDQWEGGAYLYQAGYLDVVKKIAQRCRADFQSWGVKTVVPMLDAVHYIFTRVHPSEMGVDHGPEFVNFYEWLEQKLDSGRIPIKNKLALRVTVHDNCYSKPLGDECWNRHRGILARCGCEIVEMEHIRADAMCCGFGKGASWSANLTLPFEIIAEGAKKFRDAEATGADALVSYCGGCIYLLWAARELLESKIDIFHSLEIVRMAMGEKLNYPHDHIRRAWDIIAIITYVWMRSLFQKNFFIEEITYDRNRSTFIPRRYPALRIMRRLFDMALARKIYAASFRALMAAVQWMKRRRRPPFSRALQAVSLKGRAAGNRSGRAG